MKGLQRILPVVVLGILLTGCGNNSYDVGIEKLENGQYEEAAEEFSQAVKEEKNEADSYRGMGIALWETEDYKGAKEAFEKALEQGTKKTGTLLSLLGNCELKLGNPKEAAKWYEEGLQLKDLSEELAREMEYNIIVALEQQKDMEGAKERLSQYLEKYPEDEEAEKEAEFLETR